MLDWRKFADEVPTEPRDVLIRYQKDADCYALEAWVRRGDEWVDGVNPDGNLSGHAVQPSVRDFADWLPLFGDLLAKMTWAYVDPPESA